VEVSRARHAAKEAKRAEEDAHLLSEYQQRKLRMDDNKRALQSTISLLRTQQSKPRTAGSSLSSKRSSVSSLSVPSSASLSQENNEPNNSSTQHIPPSLTTHVNGASSPSHVLMDPLPSS
jgi:protein subunit release factor B